MAPYYPPHYYTPSSKPHYITSPFNIANCIICGIYLGPKPNAREQKKAYGCQGGATSVLTPSGPVTSRERECEVLRCGECLNVQRNLEFMSCDQLLRPRGAAARPAQQQSPGGLGWFKGKVGKLFKKE